MIRTVLGDIKPETLGWCQCHEHLFIEKGKSRTVNPALYLDDIDKAVEELNQYSAHGGASLVDAQPVACGRMAENLAEASRRTGINIIGSTGFHKLIFYDEDSIVYTHTEDQLTHLFIDEIAHGMISSLGSGSCKTPYRAGMIKAAVDSSGIFSSSVSQKLFESAAAASRSTGVSVMCHMETGADAFEILDFMRQRSIEPAKVILCHLDRTRYDFAYHEALAQAGAYLEYDTIRRYKYHDDEAEAQLIIHMVESGYADRLLMGLDTTSQRLRSYGSEMGLDFILTDFSQRLSCAGLHKEVNMMMLDNPRRALSVNN